MGNIKKVITGFLLSVIFLFQSVSALPKSPFYGVNTITAATSSKSLGGFTFASLLFPDGGSNGAVANNIIEYILSVTISGQGSVTKSPDQLNYDDGAAVTLTASPEAGWQFTGWSGDATGTINPLSFNMDADKSITANFLPITYTLSTAVDGSGTVTKSPDQPSYTSGSAITLTAVPSADYQFTGWSGAITSTSNPVDIIIDNDKSVKAAFTPITYTIAVTAVGNGTITKTPDQEAYLKGTSLTLAAIPAGGNKFTAWNDGNQTITTNPLTFTVDANRSGTATFVHIQHSLNVTANGNGTVNKSPDQALYDEGSNVVLTPVAAAGYQFSGWSGAGASSENPLTITMDADKTLTANFTLIPPVEYTLNIAISGNGSVTKSPDQNSYTAGSNISLTALPANGYQFTGWSGAATGSLNPLTITMDADKSLTANFAPVQYTLVVSVSGNGTVTKNPNQVSYQSGANVSLTATPATGQQFSGWSGDVSGTANPLSIVMNSNKSVTAIFAPSSASVITNITTTTTNTYALGQLTVGAVLYTDRTYQATAVPAILNNAPFIKTPNSDKGVKTTSALSFTLTRNATVYVAYDPRATALPAWLSTWQKSALQLGINDPGISNLTFYSKSYAAGKVTLGGNLASPAAGALNEYIVVALVQPNEYTLSTSVSGSGTIAKNPDQPTYLNGANVILTATPAAGQQFTGWSGAVTSTTNPLTISMDANKAVQATFAPIATQYTLTVNTAGAGTVAKSPNQASYQSGSSVVLTATPAAGQQFTGWSGGASGTTNPLTIVMDASKSVTATFVPIYTLDVTVSGNGSVSKNPDQPSYVNGTNVVLTASPLAGQQFTGWSGSASGTTNPLTIIMDAAKSVTATFVPIYTLDVTVSGNGSVSKNPDQPFYVSGTNVVLTATPAAGQQFTGWSGSVSGNTNPLTISMDASKSVTANFAALQFSLTVSISGNGTVSKNPDQPSYQGGTDVVLTATPAAGQQFSGWSGAVVSTSNPLTVTVDAAKSLTATFAPIQYSLLVGISGTGTVAKSPDQPAYGVGVTVTLTANPGAGQQFTGWSGDIISTTNPLSVTMNSNKAFSANFSATPVPLISNIAGTSSNPYTLGQLVSGTTIYTDRTYTATTVPGFLNNAPCIKTPNADKTSKSTALLSFNLSQDATVYVAYDPRSTASPTWLSSFQKLTTEVGFTDPSISGLLLYSKVFPPGKVTLGGNLATPGAGALDNYFVIAVAIPKYTLTTTINGLGTITRNPDSPTYKSGTNVTLTTTPSAGLQFMGWSGDTSGRANPLTIKMTGNKTVMATFAQGIKSIYFTQATQTAEVAQGASQDLLEYISTSDNIPASVKLNAVADGGNIPTWLSVNGSILNGINFTANSEITFTFDATNLSIGTYSAVVTASSAGYDNAVLNLSLTVKQASTGELTNLKVNFQDSATVPPTGYLRDYGQAFGTRNSAYQQGDYIFGWLKKSDNTPLSFTKNGRNRNTPADVLLATFIHMQGNNVAGFTGTKVEGIWEAQVANGNYDVTVSVGDANQVDSKHSINVEGVTAINAFVPTTTTKFKVATATVSVADGFLTLDATGGINTKINYVIIKPSSSKRPSVIDVDPENSSQNVSENTSISTAILNLPNGGIDNSTITTDNVYLIEEGTGNLIPANVNGTGGGDAITLVPLVPLKLTKTYIFTITSGVKDLSGAAFIPYSSAFTTGSGSTSETITAKFDKIDLPNAKGDHSSLTIGPDGKLYALSIDGLIKRFPINTDGTLGKPDSLYSLQDQSGTRTPTLAISLAFDPAATATNLIAWITHSSSYVFLNGPAWDGKLTKLTGANLQSVQDVVVNLPRSAKDHVTNSIAFGPDGALYFTQASTSAMGSADTTWNNRNECLLSAAVLRLDVSKLGALPLNAKTPDGGGNYNPYAANAPLTIYASGIRNAYDLIWHSNGNLYTPTNGSAAGGNTPASVNGTLRPNGSVYNGPVIPALTNVPQTQKDFLFRVVKGGYYGHPNPLRGEYVMNGGNPTSSIDPAQVNAYAVGTLPDVNWRGYSFDFKNNASPDGAIEYKSNTFNGALKGKILVVRYSQHDDIITLTPGGVDNDIISSIDGISIPGFSGFFDPLNLTEDLKTGNLYVSEYGGGKIDLLRVNTSGNGVGDSTNVISDAFVRSDSYGDNNYGSDTTLDVKGNLSAGGLRRLSYLKFPLKNLNNVTYAKLRLYGYNQEDTLKVNVSAFSVANDAWRENQITYNASPAGSATALSTVGVNNVAKYYDFDVTNFVKGEATGDKVASFLIKDASNKNKKMVFNSKENHQFKPQLVVVANGDTIILSGSPAAIAAARGSMSSQSKTAPSVASSSSKQASSAADSTSLFSLEETPYLFVHNFEKPRIFPNPFHNKFNIEFPSWYQGDFTIEIIDILGKSYKVGNTRLKVGGSNMEIDISKLSLKSGTYFLKIISGRSKSEVIKLSIK